MTAWGDHKAIVVRYTGRTSATSNSIVSCAICTHERRLSRPACHGLPAGTGKCVAFKSCFCSKVAHASRARLSTLVPSTRGHPRPSGPVRAGSQEWQASLAATSSRCCAPAAPSHAPSSRPSHTVALAARGP